MIGETADRILKTRILEHRILEHLILVDDEMTISTELLKLDVLIVGCGIAGLTAALAAWIVFNNTSAGIASSSDDEDRKSCNRKDYLM